MIKENPGEYELMLEYWQEKKKCKPKRPLMAFRNWLKKKAEFEARDRRLKNVVEEPTRDHGNEPRFAAPPPEEFKKLAGKIGRTL